MRLVDWFRPSVGDQTSSVLYVSSLNSAWPCQSVSKDDVTSISNLPYVTMATILRPGLSFFLSLSLSLSKCSISLSQVLFCDQHRFGIHLFPSITWLTSASHISLLILRISVQHLPVIFNTWHLMLFWRSVVFSACHRSDNVVDHRYTWRYAVRSSVGLHEFYARHVRTMPSFIQWSFDYADTAVRVPYNADSRVSPLSPFVCLYTRPSSDLAEHHLSAERR